MVLCVIFCTSCSFWAASLTLILWCFVLFSVPPAIFGLLFNPDFMVLCVIFCTSCYFGAASLTLMFRNYLENLFGQNDLNSLKDE